MAIWRSVAVEEILGGPLDESGLTAGALQRLVDQGVAESEQLEFKAANAYAPRAKDPKVTWREGQEFAKDVCLFANHVGGMILIGIDEDEQVAARVAAPERADPYGEEQRLRQGLARHASPAVRVEFVAIPLVDGGHASAVIVPPSDQAPHGVAVDPANDRRPLCFPIRDGAHLRYLGEAELAERYQRRFLGAAERRAREERVVAEGLAALERSAEVWCYVTVVPSAAAADTMNREAATRFYDWLSRVDIASPRGLMVAPSGPPLPGPGRLTISDHPRRDEEDVDEPREQYLELHADGAFFGASALREIEGGGQEPLDLADAVILNVEAGLRWALERIGRWGSATVICGLRTPDGEAPLQLRSDSFGETRRVRNTRRVSRPPSSRRVADLSAAATVQDRMVVAYEAGSGLIQHFGLAEMIQLAPNGAINTDTWGRAANQVLLWARDHGVEPGNSTTQRTLYAPGS